MFLIRKSAVVRALNTKQFGAAFGAGGSVGAGTGTTVPPASNRMDGVMMFKRSYQSYHILHFWTTTQLELRGLPTGSRDEIRIGGDEWGLGGGSRLPSKTRAAGARLPHWVCCVGP